MDIGYVIMQLLNKTLPKGCGYMKKKANKKDFVFYIFSSMCIFLSVYSFALLRKLTGDPTTKMLTDVLIILLLVVLNTAVIVLHEIIKSKRK